MMRVICTLVFLGWTACDHPHHGVSWSQREPLRDAEEFTYTLQVDEGKPVVLHPTCRPKTLEEVHLGGEGTICAAPFAFPRSGKHTFTLKVGNQYGEVTSKWMLEAGKVRATP